MRPALRGAPAAEAAPASPVPRGRPAPPARSASPAPPDRRESPAPPDPGRHGSHGRPGERIRGRRRRRHRTGRSSGCRLESAGTRPDLPERPEMPERPAPGQEPSATDRCRQGAHRTPEPARPALSGRPARPGVAGATGPTGANGLSQYAYIYNTGAQVVPIEADISFDTNGVITPGITHATGNAAISVANAGTYEVRLLGLGRRTESDGPLSERSRSSRARSMAPGPGPSRTSDRRSSFSAPATCSRCGTIHRPRRSPCRPSPAAARRVRTPR